MIATHADLPLLPVADGVCQEGVCVGEGGVVTDGLLAHYGFNDLTGTVVRDAVAPPLDLLITQPIASQWGIGYLDVDDANLVSSLAPLQRS